MKNSMLLTHDTCATYLATAMRLSAECMSATMSGTNEPSLMISLARKNAMKQASFGII